MKILVTGSRGMVGTRLVQHLTSNGHEVTRMVRGQAKPGEISWDPDKGQIERGKLEGFDAVVHLAGENIASGRWTAQKKEAIRASRMRGTQLLAETLAVLDKPPSVFVSASAIGYYGDRCDEVLTEASTAGSGFLAELCKDWEAATRPASRNGVRVVNLRIGVVLAPNGGALQKMLPPFQMGAGGRIGSGKQYMSWVSLDDMVGIIEYAIQHRELSGPVNAVAPQAVTNDQFTAALGAALRRPTIFPVPGFAAHLLLGEMADELLLSSALVRPTKLLSSGYTFRHPQLEPMLKEILRRGAA